MLSNSFPSFYICYLTVLVILLLVSLINKRRDVTPWAYRKILCLFVFLISFFSINYYFNSQVARNSIWYIYWNIFSFQLLYFLPLLYIFFVLAKRKPKNIYFIVHNKWDILWGINIGIVVGALNFLRSITNKDAIFIDRIFYYIDKGMLPFYFTLPILIIIGPLAEEIIFRGILIPTLEEKMKTGYALVLSVFLFGLMHGSLYQSIIPVFLGAIVGGLFIKRRTVIPGFIVHSMLNFSYFLAIHLTILGKL